MINKYTYSGVNKGCFIASTQISVDSDELEIKMRELHQDNIDNLIPLKVLVGEIFATNASSLMLEFGKDSGDRWVLNNLANKDGWTGHITKIDGVWLCSATMASAISLFYFNKKFFTTKKEKDYSDIIGVLGVKTSYKFTRYMDCVNHITEINKCSESHAKNLLTKFIKEGLLIKHSLAKSYKVATATDIVNVTPEPTIPVTNNRDKYAGLDMNMFTVDSAEYKLALSFISQYKNAIYVKDIVAFMHTNEVYFENDVRCILLLLESNGLIAISDKYDTIKVV
ncbi:MAG: hypothetical protein RL308_2803 [Bacteroidota bacterium]|jgi:hypothetical protein